MQCPKCLLDDVEYNEKTNMFYCPDCHSMWSKKRERNVPPLISMIINFIMLIFPINFVLLILLTKLRVKEEQIKTYSMNIVNSIFIVIGLMFVILNMGIQNKDDIMKKYNQLSSTISTDILFQANINAELEEQLKQEKLLNEEKEKERKLREELLYEEEFSKSLSVEVDTPIIYYLNDVVLSGRNVKAILDDANKCNNVSVFIQTEGIANKFSKQTYVCYLKTPTESESLSSKGDRKFIEFSKKKTFNNSDFEWNEELTAFDDFDNKRSIYQLKDSASFNVGVKVQGDFILLKFQEVYLEEED